MTNLKFEYTTCKEELRKKTPIKDLITSKFVIYLTVLVLVYFGALLLFYNNSPFDFSIFSLFIGLGSWILFYTESQKIIDINLFTQFFLLSLIILVLSLILIVLTESSFYNFIMTGYSLLYLLYFRVLLFFFYRDFASSYKKPTILFASRYSKWFHENIDSAYVVTKKERLFSNLLFFGPPAIAGFLAYLIIG